MLRYLRHFLASVILVLLCSLTWAQSYKPDARAIGLGGSLVTQARDATALFWNPANLSGLKDLSILLSVNDPFQFNFVAFNQFIPDYGTFAIGFSRFRTRVDSLDRATAAWGRNWGRWFSLGGSFSFDKVGNQLFTGASTGIFIGNATMGGIDNRWRSALGAPIWDRLSLGIVVNNIPLGEQIYDLSVALGASYLLPRPGILLNLGYQIFNGKNTKHVGLGFEVSNRLTLLVGAQDLNPDFLGLGIDYRRRNLNVQASYTPDAEKFLVTLSTRISAAPAALAAPHYERGIAHLRERHFKRANREFKRYLAYGLGGARTDSVRQLTYALSRRVKRTDFVVDSLFAVSRTLLKQGEPKFLRAALILNRIIELDPDNRLATKQLDALKPAVDVFVEKTIADGIREFEANRYFLARRHFRRTIVFEKDNATALYYLSSIDKVLADIGEEYFYKGVGYYREREYQLALEQFENAIEHNPDMPEAKSYLDRTKERMKERTDQIAKLMNDARLLEERKKYVEATNTLLQVLRIEPEHHGAKAAIDGLRPKIDRYVGLKFKEAQRLYQEGNFARAAEVYNHVLSIDGDHSGARNGLAKMKREQKERFAFYLVQAKDLQARGQWKDALQQFDRALAIEPDNSEALQGRQEVEQGYQIESWIAEGREQIAAGNLSQASHLFQQVLDMDPDNVVARNELLSSRERLNKLVEDYFNRGINLYTLDRYQDAIQQLNKVLELDPKHKGALDYIHQAQERIAALRRLN